MTTLPENARLAVLIDADNTSAKRAGALLEEVAKHGTATVRRAYGDWASDHMNKWKPQLNLHAIQPIQQFAYTTGKNATDFALVIDAMDLLYADNLDGFVIVSSDSDFTRLAVRLRESGKYVLGMGESKTPKPFQVACDQFTVFDVLGPSTPGEPAKEERDSPTPAPPPLEPVLRAAIDSTSQDDGWSSLSALGSQLVKRDPSFDPRLYGHSKLLNLVKNEKYVEVKTPPATTGGAVRVRLREPVRRAAAKARTPEGESQTAPKVSQRTRSSARTR